MKNRSLNSVGWLSLFLVLAVVCQSFGDLKVIVRPWGKPIVVEPKHPDEPPDPHRGDHPPPDPRRGDHPPREPYRRDRHPPEPRYRHHPPPLWPFPVPVVPAPEPLPAPYRVEGQVGWVDLDVRPGSAEVYADGDYRGKARAFRGRPSYLRLPPGRHEVSLRQAGYRSETFVVHIAENRVVALDVTLEAVPQGTTRDEARHSLDLTGTARLALRATPADASVYIDDVFYGPASKFCDYEGAIVLPAGEHRLEVARPGYVTHVGTFRLSSGEAKEMHVELERAAARH